MPRGGRLNGMMISHRHSLTQQVPALLREKTHQLLSPSSRRQPSK